MNLSKKIILSFLSIFLIACLYFHDAYGSSGKNDAYFFDLENSLNELRSLVSKSSHGAVSVSVYDDTGALRNSGTGFFIDNDGSIITNASIWKDAYSAEVLSDLNSYSEILIANLNEDLDIALIKIKAVNEIPLELDFIYETNLGDRVIIVGKLNSQVNTVSEGVVSSLSKIEGNTDLIEIQTTVSILPYQSSKDGPVMNTAGKVIGVASDKIFERRMSDGNWRGFNNDQMHAVSLQSIKSLLSNSAHTERLHSAKSRIWFKWFMSFIKSIVLTGFMYLYDIGLTKIVTYLIVIILIIYIGKLLYFKFIKTKEDS